MIEELSEERDKLRHTSIVRNGARLLAHNVGNKARVRSAKTDTKWSRWPGYAEECVISGTLVREAKIVAEPTLRSELLVGGLSAPARELANSTGTFVEELVTGISFALCSLSHGHCWGKALNLTGLEGSSRK